MASLVLSDVESKVAKHFQQMFTLHLRSELELLLRLSLHFLGEKDLKTSSFKQFIYPSFLLIKLEDFDYSPVASRPTVQLKVSNHLS